MPERQRRQSRARSAAIHCCTYFACGKNGDRIDELTYVRTHALMCHVPFERKSVADLETKTYFNVGSTRSSRKNASSSSSTQDDGSKKDNNSFSLSLTHSRLFKSRQKIGFKVGWKEEESKKWIMCFHFSPTTKLPIWSASLQDSCSDKKSKSNYLVFFFPIPEPVRGENIWTLLKTKLDIRRLYFYFLFPV